MATVLIADDDANARLLVRTVLASAGHAVIEAPDGATALESATLHHPDLILLDLSMPGMSGAAVVRALRAGPPTRALTIALYTATRPDAALRDFMEMYGIEDVVPKPSEPLDLICAVERALQRRH